MGRFGGQIGRGLANGEPAAFVLAAFVVAAFLFAFKFLVYWRSS
jgi:hypothetical protein